MVAIAFPITLEFQNMPLAVYREVQAHLSQILSLRVDLLPQTASHFEYQLSQIGGVAIASDPSTVFSDQDQSHFKQILTYYSDRYPLKDQSFLKQL